MEMNFREAKNKMWHIQTKGKKKYDTVLIMTSACVMQQDSAAPWLKRSPTDIYKYGDEDLRKTDWPCLLLCCHCNMTQVNLRSVQVKLNDAE